MNNGKVVNSDLTCFLYDTQSSIIAQYTSTTANTAPDRWFVHGNGFQTLAMLREPDNTAGLNHLAAFIETWLAGTGDGGYNSSYDFDSSGFVDMNDLDTMADLYDFEITHPSAYYYLHDALGSTMGLLTDYPDANDWNEFYRYDAWGNIVDGSSVDNPFLWAGYYHDEETNDYYCMNRYYKPTLARWTQNDPYRYIDGINLYEYVKSRPIIALDPLGLAAYVFLYDSADPDNMFKTWAEHIRDKIEKGKTYYSKQKNMILLRALYICCLLQVRIL